MFRSKSFAGKLKIFIVAVAVFIAVGGFLNFGQPEIVTASSAGPPPAHTGAAGEMSCRRCHNSFGLNSGGGFIRISGLPYNYLPHQEVPVTVTLKHEDGRLYGFQLTAVDAQGRSAGEFILPAENPPLLQTTAGLVNGNLRNYVMHAAESLLPNAPDTRTWNFIWRAPAARAGRISFHAAGNAANNSGDTRGDYIYASSGAARTGGSADFDGDGKTDIAVFRPSSGDWYWLNSLNNQFAAFRFGANGDQPLNADFDGDGKTDFAVYRGGNWFVWQSSNSGFRALQFGAADDTPLSGDFSGDGKADFAVFRSSTGVWYWLDSASGAFHAAQFGAPGDVPIAGDFDGDGKSDYAVFRRSAGDWYILQSSNNQFRAERFGASEDKPVRGDFDGDGRQDIAVFRPSVGVWYLQQSSAGFKAVALGSGTDKLVPADYDDDGKTDAAVFRHGVWHILQSSNNEIITAAFGANNDLPIPE